MIRNHDDTHQSTRTHTHGESAGYFAVGDGAAVGADAAAGAARLCDWARRARREHLTRRAASGRCASLSGGGGGAAAAAGGADAAAGAARLSDATRCARRGNLTRRAASRAAAIAARRWRWGLEAWRTFEFISWSSTRTGGQPGGRGFDQATEDRGPSRGQARQEGALGRSGWSSRRWVAPRRLGRSALP